MCVWGWVGEGTNRYDHADNSNTPQKGEQRNRRNLRCWIMSAKKAVYPLHTPTTAGLHEREISF